MSFPEELTGDEESHELLIALKQEILRFALYTMRCRASLRMTEIGILFQHHYYYNFLMNSLSISK